MCGIVGYVGHRSCSAILLDGLRRLEYRGYDSAGIAVVRDDGECHVRRAAGKLRNLAAELERKPVEGTTGIGHTRWATHGAPTTVNAHPHRVGPIVVVHNGIIENHLALRRQLEAEGRRFQSETDTEIIAHLIDRACQETPETPLVECVRRALRAVHGSYALAVLDARRPDVLVAARHASPLVVGLGEGENFVASDIPALLEHTRRVVFLADGEAATLRADGVEVVSIESGEGVEPEVVQVQWSPAMAEKGGYKHFMLKEIHEQPWALTETIRGRVSLERGEVEFEDVALDRDALAGIDRLIVVACGTSWHAGLVGRYLVEYAARLPVDVELASEFRYRDPLVGPNTLVVAISQSGETADTLAAVRLCRERGARVLSICNVVGSSMARLADDVVYTRAGPEIGVASTKAFTTQLATLYLLGVHLGRLRGTIDRDHAVAMLQDLVEVPAIVESVLADEDQYIDIARRMLHVHSALYLGRGLQYPIALEGALKLKEISYIHAEGYAAGEMKHGPIALVDESVPTVMLIARDRHYDKALSNLAEIRARGGPVVAIATEGDDAIAEHARDVIYVPAVPELLVPIVTAVPVQLLAYHVADLKGTDVDQPRNLAKSVTVE